MKCKTCKFLHFKNGKWICRFENTEVELNDRCVNHEDRG